MKKFYFLIGLLFLTSNSIAQKYFTRTGTITFEASVPSFEEVKAKNNTTTAILNIETGEIAALALIKGFRFKIALMEEHFNESFAESNMYPKATFKGKIENFIFNNLTEIQKPFSIIGTLAFHGKSVDINTLVYISINNDEILLTSEFIVKSEDFGIKIPKIIRKKVAETVTVSINFKFMPKK